MISHIWYASYGSNLAAQRFACYLQGGRPDGAHRVYPGARDASPPSASRALLIDGRLFFGWESPTWGGGVAFLDTGSDGQVFGRAYRITGEQFADVVAQEMRREPGTNVDLHALLDRRLLVLGEGRYETVLMVDTIDDELVVTFTCPSGCARPPINTPTAPYLVTIARGLAESHRLSAPDVVEYLGAAPGIAGSWPRPDLVTAVSAAIGS